MDPELTELAVALNRFSDRIDKLERVSSTAQISVNAGGAGLWAAVTACLVMLALSIVLAVFVASGMADLNRQTQELRQTDATLQAYINVMYAPKDGETAESLGEVEGQVPN